MDLVSVSSTESIELAMVAIAMILIPPLFGMMAGCVRNSVGSAKVSRVLCMTSCAAGIFAYPIWVLCSDVSVSLGIESAIGPYSILMDQISALMVSVSSGVYLLVMVHMHGSSHDTSGKYAALLNALFLACVLCILADSVAVLVMGWEAVSLLTFLLAFRNDDERSRWLFFVVTHIGGLVLLGTYAYMASVSGTFILSEWDGLAETMGSTVSSIIIFLLFIGFGSKLGTIPFHAWMTDMYGQTPTHTTVLLSTVCSNVAVLVLFKSVFGYVGMIPGLEPVALLLILLSSVSALWGAMESMVQNRPKRILAYSSMENMGLVTLCMSMAIIFSAASGSLMNLVLIAALLHTINHSVFKSLMLLTVHSIQDCTGEDDISRFGGIGKALPAFSMIALIGTASMAAIPPMNGFVSEWLMIQSMIVGDASETVLKLVMPLTVAVLGICGMMAATSYVRLYGFTFLGRPRSEGASSPRKLSGEASASLGLLAVMCIAFGIFALELTDVLSSGLDGFLGMDGYYKDALSGSFMPFILGIMVLGTVAILYAVSRMRSAPATEADTWGCGGDLDEYMQYTSMGFSQPLVRVFHPIYGDISKISRDDSGRHKVYHLTFTEPFVKFIYRPIGRFIAYVSKMVERLQTGNIQSYLGYILVVLVVALLGVRLL